MDLASLKDPFAFEDVEWRIQSSGLKSDKTVWARCLCYITNRAIQDRLDEVCGPENWCNEFKEGPLGGVICGISIYCNDRWVTKWDGSDNTDIKTSDANKSATDIKGGLSSSMKRAGSQWGIGRYLYQLEEGWALTSLENKLMNRARTKEKVNFTWNPPALPQWALPGD